MSHIWVILEGVNPEPWVPSRSSGGMKDGKRTTRMYQPAQLANYKEAIAEEAMKQKVEVNDKVPTPILCHFYFFRQVESFERADRSKKSANYADATNLQKATEDALQKIFYDNDRTNVEVLSRVVMQDTTTTPLVVVYLSDEVDAVPSFVLGAYKMASEVKTMKPVKLRGAPDLF